MASEVIANISSGNQLSPQWPPVITWTNAVVLLTGTLETKFSGDYIKIQMKKKRIWKCCQLNVSISSWTYLNFSICQLLMADLNVMLKSSPITWWSSFYHNGVYTYSVCNWFVAYTGWWWCEVQIDGLVQDRSNFIANALELLQSCTKPLKCIWFLSYDEKWVSHKLTAAYTLLAKKVVTPRDDVSFLWLFLFHQSARSKDRLFGVI